MARPNSLAGDVSVEGTVTANAVVSKTATITNAMVSTTAAIDATKNVQQRLISHVVDGSVSTQTIPVFVASGAGTSISFEAGLDNACTTGSITVDLHKGGSTVLSTTITLDAVTNNAARTMYAGTFSASTVAADDWFEFVITNSSSDGTDLLIQYIVNEAAAT